MLLILPVLLTIFLYLVEQEKLNQIRIKMLVNLYIIKLFNLYIGILKLKKIILSGKQI